MLAVSTCIIWGGPLPPDAVSASKPNSPIAKCLRLPVPAIVQTAQQPSVNIVVLFCPVFCSQDRDRACGAMKRGRGQAGQPSLLGPQHQVLCTGHSGCLSTSTTDICIQANLRKHCCLQASPLHPQHPLGALELPLRSLGPAAKHVLWQQAA